jgi:hypothetical protein
MDTEKVLAATAAIRQMLERYPFGFRPNPTTRQEAKKELDIVWQNSPASCEGKIISVSAWLDILFDPERREKHGDNTPARVKEVQKFVLGDLAKIEAALIAQGRGTA